MRILFVSGIISPFWLELAEAVEAIEGFAFRAAFCDLSLRDRGKHWQNSAFSLEKHFVRPQETKLEPWLEQVFDSYKPQVVICGGVRTNFAQLALKLSSKHESIFGYFAEQPNKGAFFFTQNIKKVIYRKTFSSARPRFFLAAGDRAADIYRQWTPSPCNVAVFPYYQDLSKAYNSAQKKIDLPIRFLFSGRLIPRNSIREMAAAFERLATERPGQFSWCISAHGPEEHYIRKAAGRTPQLEDALSFDREFDNWNDRLRPFKQADVLVVPAYHSGWGLVVPEALAAGLPVISTPYVEAARYYIEEMVNGLFVEPTANSIFEALKYCVDNFREVEFMAAAAPASAQKGDVQHGAERLVRLFKRWFG